MKKVIISTFLIVSSILVYKILKLKKDDNILKIGKIDTTEESNQKKLQAHLKSLTINCDMTTFEGRLNCFKDKISENRKNNKNIPTQYTLIGHGFSQKLKASDLGDILQIERPQEISIKSCAAKSIYFDWNQSYFFISPDSFDSGAICDSTKGRIAIVPSNLTNAQIQEFYKTFNKR